MSAKQKKGLVLLTVIGLVYFLAFFFPNATGAEDEEMLRTLSADESITYPVVVRMLTPDAAGVENGWFRWIIYGDYHYGYPFYFLSAVVLLPVRILLGTSFVEHTQLNLLLLRQFISVLPMIFAAGFLVYLQTRFRSVWQATGLFVFMLAVPGFVRNHLYWWHPDGLSVLFVVLVIYFLDRDSLKYGRDFYLAAFFCGLAVAIKLAGLFFFLTIPAYVAAGFITKKIDLKGFFIRCTGFVVIMVMTVILSNPFLFYPSARDRMLQIQQEKSYEISHGYTHEESPEYAKGPRYWEPTLSRWYGRPFFLGFLALSLLGGVFFGAQQFSNRVLLGWIVPFSIYILFFVAVKPDHYWLPVIIPLFSCTFIIPDALWRELQNQREREKSAGYRGLVLVLFAVTLVILTTWFIQNINYDYTLYRSYLEQENTRGFLQMVCRMG